VTAVEVPAGHPALRRFGRIIVFVATGMVVASILMVLIYRLVPPPATPLMLIRLTQGNGIDKSWKPLAEISPNLIRAVISGEDAKFCRHHGFDWDAVEAGWQRYKSGTGRLRGASTISMQTAKNVFLWPGRDWPRKAIEAYFTELIELFWGKRRIVEVYLNVVEFGPSIYGAEAASRYYFHKPAAALSEIEASRLAAILPDPRHWSASRPNRYVIERSAFIRAQFPELQTAEPLPCGG
jgi:monofunctional biosynthetic peptidoglycan transglycosylase